MVLAKKGQSVDTLIYTFEQQISRLESINNYKQSQLEICGELIQLQVEQIKDLQDANVKLSKRETFFKRLCIGLASAVIIETIILL